ncbi:MAG: hypothetical protein RL662_218 [Bacteroidota bacterium]|jgi:hypothetical protein
MKKIIFLLFVLCIHTSCDLDQDPVSEITKTPVFNSPKGLELYTNSFYEILPSADNIHRSDNMCDYAARSQVPNFLRKGSYSSRQSDGWDWRNLRNVNYFIQNCNSPEVNENVKKNHLGIARFFRAYFYFEKVQRFGDVPWVDRPLENDDPALYGGRDSRTIIMDHMLEDLNYAIENITAIKDPSSSLITKSVALAFKSRVCLFEGTFRKYHTNYNLSSTADKWLKEAELAAKGLIDSKQYSINIKTNNPYRDLFISEKAIETEVILASVCNKSLGVLNDANWWWTSATYGSRLNLTRTFVNTYLKLDGTPFTNTVGYETMVFFDEVQNRDKRLSQTIRTPGYKRINAGVVFDAAPDFTYTYTGYHPIKFCLDATSYDNGGLNDNTIPMMRYAEVLLNYAEARAELGLLTDADWLLTIGELRGRAGIAGGLTTKPTVADAYLQSNYFPEISDPSLLEIRRERAIELVFEGLRLSDLIRWKKGDLVKQDWNGIYVPALDVPMDLDGNGTFDVCFTQQAKVSNPLEGITYVNVAPMRGDVVNPQLLKDGTKGEVTWMKNISKDWDDKNYLYPVPEMAIIMNNNLKPQNAGW